MVGGLAVGEVHVWTVSLDVAPRQADALAEVLSPDERERAARFLADRDRRRFVVGRGVLRTTLGRYTGIAPDALQFRYGTHGKPALAGARWHDLNFNVSHSKDTTLYAVALRRRVGIDIEHVRSDIETDEIATRFFSVREAATLRALPTEQRLRAFFRIWTRKEAFLKGKNDGLSVSLGDFDVSCDEHARLLSSSLGASNWSLRELFANDDQVAAIAVEGTDWVLRQWN
jgi:4'-phosphopantetheinyl transferase